MGLPTIGLPRSRSGRSRVGLPPAPGVSAGRRRAPHRGPPPPPAPPPPAPAPAPPPPPPPPPPPSLAPAAAAEAFAETRRDRTQSLAEKIGVRLQPFVNALVRLLHPPGEERIIAIIEAVPRPRSVARRSSTDASARLAASRLTLSLEPDSRSTVRRASLISLVRPSRDVATFAHSIVFTSRRAASRSRIFCANGTSGAARARSLRPQVELAKLVGQIVLEQQVVDLAVLSQPVELELLEPVQPLPRELAHLFVARRRSRRRCRRLEAYPVDRSTARSCPAARCRRWRGPPGRPSLAARMRARARRRWRSTVTA